MRPKFFIFILSISILVVEIAIMSLPLFSNTNTGPMIPSCLLNYRYGDEQYILVVEKLSQTLLIYSNYNPEPIEKFKITSGKNNGPKILEGDMKTPEGIYFFKQILSSGELPKTDDYGEKAFTMNYPNPIDKRDKKDGSGIWLHGAFDPNKIKSPYNSRGCVVLDNKDLIKISKYIFLNRTPICIYEKIKYETVDSIQKKREHFLNILKEWKTRWEEKNIDGYIDCYDENFAYDGMNLSQFKSHKNLLNQRYRFIRVFFSNIQLYAFEKYVVAHFNQLYISDVNQFSTQKIQYWREAGDFAKIVDETSSSMPSPAKVELDNENFVTIAEFRKDFLKQLQSQSQSQTQTGTTTVVPSDIRLKNIQFMADKVKFTMLAVNSNPASSLKVIPVIRLEKGKEEKFQTLEGVSLNGGVPQDFAGALKVENREFSITLPKAKDFQVKSITLFLLNRKNAFEQIVSYFINH